MTLAVGRLWCVQGRAYRNPRPPSLFLTVTLTGFCLLAVTVRLVTKLAGKQVLH